MLRYQEQNSELTLKEGLEEFYSINPHFKVLSEPDEIKGLFFQHDITHVVFGLNSKLEEEHLLLPEFLSLRLICYHNDNQTYELHH